MIEIELKYQIDKKKVKSLLDALKIMNFVVGKRNYEKTVMFDNPDQTMQVTDGRIRLRQTGDSAELSYKKPITRNGIKREIEHEVIVSDFKITEKILKEMLFTPVSSYERYRITAKDFTEKIKVTIDEFPFADFIEIEGPEKLILSLSDELKLNKTKNLTKSCDTLFQEWRTVKGLDFKSHLLFNDFDK